MPPRPSESSTPAPASTAAGAESADAPTPASKLSGAGVAGVAIAHGKAANGKTARAGQPTGKPRVAGQPKPTGKRQPPSATKPAAVTEPAEPEQPTAVLDTPTREAELPAEATGAPAGTGGAPQAPRPDLAPEADVRPDAPRADQPAVADVEPNTPRAGRPAGAGAEPGVADGATDAGVEPRAPGAAPSAEGPDAATVASATEVPDAATPAPAADSAADPAPDAAERKAVRLLFGLAAVAVLLVAASVVLGVGAFAARKSGPLANQAFLDSPATADVVGQVTNALSTAFSYDYKTLPANEAAARAVIAPEYVDQFNRVFQPVKQLAPQEQATVKTTVAGAGVSLLQDDRARLLMMVNQVGTRGGADQVPTGSSTRLVVDARKVDGQWKISGINSE